MELHFTNPSLEDVKEISKLADKFPSELGWVTHGEIKGAIETNTLLICRDRQYSKIVGYVLFYTRKTDGVTRINSICVHPEYQGRGIGKKLFDRVPTPIILSCPESAVVAQEFYLRQGLEISRVKKGRKQKLIEFKTKDNV